MAGPSEARPRRFKSCRMVSTTVFGSTRARYRTGSCRSNHAFDVGGIGGKCVDGVANLAGGDSESDGEREQVNELFARMADEVSAEDSIGFFVDNHLGPGDRLV